MNVVDLAIKSRERLYLVLVSDNAKPTTNNTKLLSTFAINEYEAIGKLYKQINGRKIINIKYY